MGRECLGAGAVSQPPAPPPGFTLDGPMSRKRDGGIPPPPPPGFALQDERPSARPGPVEHAAPSLGMDSIAAPIDGDTLRLRVGAEPAPVGRRCAGAEATGLGPAGPAGADRAAVARGPRPASLAGIGGARRTGGRQLRPPGRASDARRAGPRPESLARNGNALAAPEYLRADPQRRFEYMQAERLARQNRLGVHDTMFQTPADFRRAPMPTPERETVAQFWDTPTPMAGMRPEDEQSYLALVNDASVTPKAIQDYARANGFTVADGEVERVRADAKKKGMPIGVNYVTPPKPLTDQGDGTTGAAGRGFANGVLPNLLEEAGAVVDTLGGTAGRENVWNSDRRLADIWANNGEQNESDHRLRCVRASLGHDRCADCRRPRSADGPGQQRGGPGEVRGGLWRAVRAGTRRHDP